MDKRMDVCMGGYTIEALMDIIMVRWTHLKDG